MTNEGSFFAAYFSLFLVHDSEFLENLIKTNKSYCTIPHLKCGLVLNGLKHGTKCLTNFLDGRKLTRLYCLSLAVSLQIRVLTSACLEFKLKGSDCNFMHDKIKQRLKLPP